MWPVDFFDQVGIFLEKRLARFGRRDQYRYADGEVVRYRGAFARDWIAIEDVAEWSTLLEMGFEVVTILLKDGALVQRIDRTGELVDILKQHASQKERREGGCVDPATRGPKNDAIPKP